MSTQNDEINKNNKEDYFYRFENILIPIIPTIIIIIIAILFNKFSSKSKINNKKRKDNKENNTTKENNNSKKSLLGGNPRYKQNNKKPEIKTKYNINKDIKNNNKEIIKSLCQSYFFMPFFTVINKQKGFSNKTIENIFKEEIKEKEKLFFMDDFNSINKYKTFDNNNIKNNDSLLINYIDDNNAEKENIFNKDDIFNDYEVIIINYNSKEISLLFPKQKYIKKLSDEEILREILNSPCIKNIYKIFNINLDYKIGLSFNKIENKYNIYLVNNYITKKKITPENFENKEKNNNSNENNNYIINNINSNNIINTSKVINQENNKNNQSNIIQNEIVDDSNNKSKINNNIIINENKNNNIINNQNQNQTNNNYNTNNNYINNNQNNNNVNNIYLFPLVGLNNVGSTCFMNATLQCLLHISELNAYFLNEYPKDYMVLNNKNASSESKGNIALAYYNVVQGVFIQNIQYFNNPYMLRSFAPREFKETIGRYNSQFQVYAANDSRDLILYLLQTFHEELNYFGDQPFPLNMMMPNQENRAEIFNYFMNTYNIQNFSIISKLFYGTYENTIKCCNCNRVYYSYQKFEFISFSTYNYRRGIFNIYNGFQDNQAIQYLKGDNQYFCSSCQNLVDAESCCKIIQPPSKLLINIDYGKNKVNDVRKLIFDEIIDITQFVNFHFGKNIIYQISGVCTHLGSSGPTGHYIAYCRNKQTGLWYNFNDSSVRQCNKNEIYNGSPYLLLYEQLY